MLRRQARLRREYLYRKSVEDKHKQLQQKKENLKRSIEGGTPIHGDLRREALSLQEKLKWTDGGETHFFPLFFTQMCKSHCFERIFQDPAWCKVCPT